MGIVWSQDAAAVITPSALHLPSAAVADILTVADVIFLDTAQRYKLHQMGIAAVDLYSHAESEAI
ncbi:hypothetical protein [Nocardia sp. NPDC056100]|uniref:hypothetical protein n=1 Tax=Nocardia sp. NPDC056100 TaxID=3345712 RepID=UPI0035E17ABC